MVHIFLVPGHWSKDVMNSTVSQHHFPALLGTSKVYECQFKFRDYCNSLAKDINQSLKILPY